MVFCWGKIGEVEIGGVKLSDIRKFTKSKSSAEVIDFLYDITQTDKFKEEFDKIKARKAVNDSSEGGEFGGRGEEYANVEADSGKQDAFNGDEDISAQDNNAIDTDNALSENNVINSDGVDEVGGVGNKANVQKDTNIKSNINSIDKSEFENNDYLIANGENLEYKYNKDKTFDIALLKSKRNRAYFWSGTSNGIGDLDYAADVAKKNNGVTLEMLVENNKVSLPKWDFNNPKTVEAWANASAFYAKQASGEVRALIGTKLRENNFWENIELPKLMNNLKVTKIIKIDPETLIETIIYEVKNENNWD